MNDKHHLNTQPIFKNAAKTQKKASAELCNKNNYVELFEPYKLDSNPDMQSESKRKAKIVKQILVGEASRQPFGKIRRIVKPNKYSTLSQNNGEITS